MSDNNALVGYRKNVLGHLVPEELIKPIDKLRDDVVINIVEAANKLKEAMLEFKAASMQQIEDFIDLSAKEYGVEYGGAKGNVTLPSFDGRYKVLRAISDRRIFDERIQAAKQLINECIAQWSQGADPKIMQMVKHAFRVNKQGSIDVNQVLSLRQIDIADPEWHEAMNAIADSIRVIGSCQYFRLYERQPNGKYTQISLDMSGI